MDQLYTIEEAAKLLKVTRMTLYRFMKSGGLRYVLVGDRRRIPQSALDAFIKEGRPDDREEAEGQEAPGLMIAA
jgi:excisionase family DNA binding protein